MELTLKDFIRVIKRYALFIVIIAVIGALALGGYTYFLVKPEYSSTSTLKTEAGKSGNVKYYYDIISSDSILVSVANSVKDKYHDIDVDDIKSMLSYTQEEGFETFNLIVTCNDPNMCADLCYTIALASTEFPIYNKETLTVITKADVPTSGYHPYKKNAVIGGFVGLIAGFAVVFIILLTDKRIFESDDLTKNFEIKVIGDIPKTQIPLDGNVFCSCAHPNVKESFRKLRTNVIDLTEDSACKKVAITSAVDGEGKTTVAINLATSILLSGKKVLVIDADMKTGALTEMVGKDAQEGLSDYLNGKVSVAPVVKLENGLSVLPAGAVCENSSELLSSEKMKKFLDEVGKNYEFVIIDLPAVNECSDATTIHASVDGYLISTLSVLSNSNKIRKSIEELNQLNAKIYGFVLNGAGKKLKSISIEE